MIELEIQVLRDEISAARINFEQSRSGNRTMYDQAFNRLMKAIKKFDEVRSHRIRELGLDTF